MSLQVCILETDILRPELVDQYQSYGRMFEALFAGQPLAASFKIFNVMNGAYPPGDSHFDAYLVTGSKADSFATDPWIETLKAYLLERYRTGAKLLGICFGHQLLALLLGGRTERATGGWGVGIHRYRLLEQNDWMTPALNEVTLLISHQDQVTRLPEKATLLASSEFCVNAAYRVDNQVLCFQGHPEFVPEYSRALLDIRQQHIGHAVYQVAVDGLHQPHQGRVVGEWMLRFIAHGRG